MYYLVNTPAKIKMRLASSGETEVTEGSLSPQHVRLARHILDVRNQQNNI